MYKIGMYYGRTASSGIVITKILAAATGSTILHLALSISADDSYEISSKAHSRDRPGYTTYDRV